MPLLMKKIVTGQEAHEAPPRPLRMPQGSIYSFYLKSEMMPVVFVADRINLNLDYCCHVLFE